MAVLHSLARNTAFSAAAFGLNGLIGLALVPLIVREYGLVAFGLLVLSRALLPSGALAIFDFGLSETATQALGRARGAGNWRYASEQITLLIVIGAVIGTFAGMALIAAAPWVSELFRVDAEYRESYISILRVTAVCLVLVFPSLVAEGIVKGFERYGIVRGLEVAATLFYALGTLIAVFGNFSYAAVAYAFLTATAIRYAALVAFAAIQVRDTDFALARWSTTAQKEVLRRSLLMFQSKILGSLQMQIPPLFVGALIGPAGVGVYDVVTRLPRFLKSTLGLLASAILPVAARIESQGGVERLRALGATSFWFVPYVTFPVLFATAALAQPILEAWVGVELAIYWPWLVAMLVVPALQICLSVPQVMLLVRPDFIGASNRITAKGVVFQYAISIMLAKPLGAMSFVLGATLASIAMWPFHMRLLTRTLALEARETWRPLMENAAFAIVNSVLLYIFASYLGRFQPLLLLGLIALATCVHWGIAYFLLLGSDARDQVARVIFSLVGGSSRERIKE